MVSSSCSFSFSFSVFFLNFSAFRRCCIKRLDSFVSLYVIFGIVRASILCESLNVWMVCSSSSDLVNEKTFFRKRKNPSLVLCVGKINHRDRCKHHSWIDRILRRQIANDLLIVLASLAIGGGNLDEVR